MKKVAILANGGDVSGFNAVIRGIVKTAETHNVKCYGVIEGYKGLLENNYMELNSYTNASGILYKGGSIIGSSTNANVFNYKVEENGEVVYKDLSDICVENVKKDEFDCVFTLGGDGTQKSARDLGLKGLNIIGVPKTIDNDVACTDITFGYNTAVSVAMEALDRLHSTGETHHRIMVLEVMGRYAGWIALESAIAGGGDVALIPEIPFDLDKVAEKIKERIAKGKKFSLVVVAEGAAPKGGELTVQNTRDNGQGVDNTKLGGIGEKVAKRLQELTGLEARNTTLGYMQRGGTPTAYDRVLSTKYGSKAMELALERQVWSAYSFEEW
ncbi:MAG: ATP-dependent 6-phosphofructokinase [Clostridia bacterium]|nr:ATP-dependent 6-phosphofructokinase [Clostridia bacterium]